MIIMLIIFFTLHAILWYNREIRFYKKPYGELRAQKDLILSPVEGRVVYIREIQPFELGYSIKEGRKIPYPRALSNNRGYIHIGIYMTPLNNHHLLTPINHGYRLNIEGEKYLPMMGALESLAPWMAFVNWWDRKIEDFIGYNKRYNYDFDNGIVMSMILEKYVNRVSQPVMTLKSGRKVLGFVHRGSQLDMFVPIKEFYHEKDFRLNVKVNDRVNFDTILFSARSGK